MRVLGTLLAAVAGLWLAGFAAVFAWSALWPRTPPLPAPAEAIICLGAGMAGETSPDLGPSSAERAATCAALWRAGVAPVVVVTGAGNELRAVAEGMAGALAAEGLPDAAVLVEPRAQSTIQNAAFALAMLPAPPSRVVIVTHAFHLPRSWAIFRAFGVAEVVPYPAASAAGPLSRRALSWIARETAALPFNLARGAVYLAAGLAGVDRDTRIGWFN